MIAAIFGAVAPCYNIMEILQVLEEGDSMNNLLKFYVRNITHSEHHINEKVQQILTFSTTR